MKKFLGCVLVVIIAISFSGIAFAEEAAPQGEKTRNVTYTSGPIQKAERGFGNLAFGWTEIPKRIVDETKASNPIKGVVLGVFQGTCRAFARTASGAADLVTFPFGGYDKPAITPDMPAAK